MINNGEIDNDFQGFANEIKKSKKAILKTNCDSIATQVQELYRFIAKLFGVDSKEWRAVRHSRIFCAKCGIAYRESIIIHLLMPYYENRSNIPLKCPKCNSNEILYLYRGVVMPDPKQVTKVDLRLIKEFKGHTSWVKSVCFPPDGRYVLFGSDDVCFSPDGRYVLSGSDDKSLRLWDIATGKEIWRFKGHPWGVFSPDGRYVLSGSDDKSLRLWDIATGKEIRRFEGHPWGVDSVCFSPDGKYVLSVGEGKRYSYKTDNTILWDTATGKEIRRFKMYNEKVMSVCFSPDGRYILSGSFEIDVGCKIRLWEASTGKEIRKFEGYTSSVHSVCFSPDGRYVLSAGKDISYYKIVDETIRLWETATGKKIWKFEGYEYKINSVCFSPDGRYVLSASNDETIHLCDVATGKEIRRFEGHTNIVRSVCFSLDGRYVLSGSDDKSLRLWDIATGKEIRRLEGHSGSVNSVCFSPDGRYILSGDRTILLWELDWKWGFPSEMKEVKTFKKPLNIKREDKVPEKKSNEIPLLEKNTNKSKKAANSNIEIKKVDFQSGQEIIIKSYEWKCFCGQTNPVNQEYCRKCFKLKSNQPS